jgi:hypothetical protein
MKIASGRGPAASAPTPAAKRPPRASSPAFARLPARISFIARPSALGEAANTIRERLGKFDEIRRVDATPKKPRLTGLEVVAGDRGDGGGGARHAPRRDRAARLAGGEARGRAAENADRRGDRGRSASPDGGRRVGRAGVTGRPASRTLLPGEVVYPAAQDRVSDHRVRSKEIRPPAARAAAALVPLAACMQHHLVGRQRPSASDQRASRITLKREERPLGRWRLEFNGAFDWLEMMTTCPCRNGTCGLTSWRHADRAQDHRSGDRARFAKPP